MNPIASGGVVTLIIEALKWVWRTFIAKDPNFEFPALFYAIAVPTLNMLVMPLLALIGVEGYTMPTDWAGFARTLVQLILSSLISFVGYTAGVKPLKSYNKYLTEKKA